MRDALIRGILIRRKTKDLSFDEEDAVKSAALPDLQPISDEMLLIVKNATRRNLITVLQCLGIFAAISVVCILLRAYVLAIAVGCTIPVLLVIAFIMHLRGNIDETAVSMRVPVHSSESGLLGSVAVCYLPDGKYRITYDRSQPEPGAVDVVQFGKFTYCRMIPKSEEPVFGTVLTEETDNGKDVLS